MREAVKMFIFLLITPPAGWFFLCGIAFFIIAGLLAELIEKIVDVVVDGLFNVFGKRKTSN